MRAVSSSCGSAGGAITGSGIVPSHAHAGHRFLREGFFASLRPDELRLYVLLVLAADRNGLSFYHYDSICSLLEIPMESYIRARNALIVKDLVAFDGTRFQVLSLPERPHFDNPAPLTHATSEGDDPATIRALVRRSIDGHPQKHR